MDSFSAKQTRSLPITTQHSGCRNNPDLKLRGNYDTTVRAESTGENTIYNPSTIQVVSGHLSGLQVEQGSGTTLMAPVCLCEKLLVYSTDFSIPIKC